MNVQVADDLNIQTYMIIWDVNLGIKTKSPVIDIYLTIVSLNPTKNENTNWISLKSYENELYISSNLTTKEEFKEFTTYVMNPSTNKILDVYKGTTNFAWNHNDWSGKRRFVFELKVQCISSADPQTIWKRYTTEIKPSVTNAIVLNIDSERTTRTALTNQGGSCTVKSYLDKVSYSTPFHSIDIIPEKPTENWNLLTLILRREQNNVLDLQYLSTCSSMVGRCFSKYYPFVVFDIMELSTSAKNMTKLERASVSRMIETYLSLIKDKVSDNAFHQLNMSSSPIHMEYFITSKFCDITVQVEDHKIRAHKIVLATSSTIWRAILSEDETLTVICTVDFDYEIIKELVEYMYTGKINKATDQLLIAADKYGVVGLKDLCEKQFSETIDMKTVVNLLVLADRYKTGGLYDKVMEFIKENCTEFKKLNEAQAMFIMYPELGFKLFEAIA